MSVSHVARTHPDRTIVAAAMLTYEQRGDKLALSGAIDDTANVLGLMKHAVRGRLVLDLGGIQFINSIGVREWIRLQEAAAKAGIQLQLHGVAVVLCHNFHFI